MTLLPIRMVAKRPPEQFDRLVATITVASEMLAEKSGAVDLDNPEWNERLRDARANLTRVIKRIGLPDTRPGRRDTRPPWPGRRAARAGQVRHYTEVL